MILAGASDAASTVGSEQTETSPTPNQTGGGMEEDVTTTSVTSATPRSRNTTFNFKSGSASENSSFPFKILVVAASALVGMVCLAGGTAVVCLRKKKSSRTPSVRPKRPERTPIWRKKSTNKRAKKEEIDLFHDSVSQAMAKIQEKEDLLKEVECTVDGMITDLTTMGLQSTSPEMMSTLRKDLLRDSKRLKREIATPGALDRTDQLEGRPLLPSPYIPLASKSGRTAALACRWSAEGMVEDNLERVPMRTFGWV